MSQKKIDSPLKENKAYDSRGLYPIHVAIQIQISGSMVRLDNQCQTDAHYSHSFFSLIEIQHHALNDTYDPPRYAGLSARSAIFFLLIPAEFLT